MKLENQHYLQWRFHTALKLAVLHSVVTIALTLLVGAPQYVGLTAWSWGVFLLSFHITASMGLAGTRPTEEDVANEPEFANMPEMSLGLALERGWPLPALLGLYLVAKSAGLLSAADTWPSWVVAIGAALAALIEFVRTAFYLMGLSGKRPSQGPRQP